MSSSTSSSAVRLEVKAAFPTIEIFVIDSRFRRLAAGVGSLSTEVPPGYYKIRFRAGGTQRDQLIEVLPGQGSMIVEGEPIAYESAAPVGDTATSREAHAASAERISRQLHASPGHGSRLLLFVRDLEEEAATRPWDGVTIHALDGELVADLSDGEIQRADAFGALSLEVDPGTYRLRVDTGSLGVYEMFAVTAAGWQTQVFSLAEDFVAGSERVRRLALRSVSVLMTPVGHGFVSTSDELRLADLARLGLRTGRQVVRGEELGALLEGKFENPMLGIYGLHLLLLAHRPKHELIETVAANLQSLVGPHPDILALQLRSGAPSPPEDLSFPTPPMLKSSWDLVVQGSRRRVSLVPPGSPSDRIADGLLPSGPWLVRRMPETVAEETAAEVSFARTRRMIEGLAAIQRARPGILPPTSARSRAAGGSGGSTAFSTLEQRLLKATQPFGADWEETPEYESRISVAKILSEVDAPASSIARSVHSLFEKLDLDPID